MRTVPRTPKAGSIIVARMVADADEDADADALTLDVGVGASVRVTLYVVGITLTIASVWVPKLLREVDVKEDVPLITVTLSEGVGVEEVVWAAVERMREACRKKERRTLEGGTRASQGICMMMDVRRRERPREYMSGRKKWGMCLGG